mmetsp:Transcript_93141/g.268002  ORF Transcript_93141/g.268002 Transcript_93141/m.268002 type:complete len:337 (-) Transcript_93141:214-1224(-)
MERIARGLAHALQGAADAHVTVLQHQLMGRAAWRRIVLEQVCCGVCDPRAASGLLGGPLTHGLTCVPAARRRWRKQRRRACGSPKCRRGEGCVQRDDGRALEAAGRRCHVRLREDVGHDDGHRREGRVRGGCGDGRGNGRGRGERSGRGLHRGDGKWCNGCGGRGRATDAFVLATPLALGGRPLAAPGGVVAIVGLHESTGDAELVTQASARAPEAPKSATPTLLRLAPRLTVQAALEAVPRRRRARGRRRRRGAARHRGRRARARRCRRRRRRRGGCGLRPGTADGLCLATEVPFFLAPIPPAVLQAVTTRLPLRCCGVLVAVVVIVVVMAVIFA